MIVTEGISKTYNNIEVLRNVSITIPDHKITTIIGASGAGKTTLRQIIASLEKPTAGRVTYNDTDITKLKDKELSRFRNRNIGLVFQQHRLLPEFSILENVMMPALIDRRPKAEAKKEAAEWLDRLGLSHRLSHRPSELSGGECQRASVARALINHPLFILADEPSGSLDTENRRRLHRIFFDLRNEFGTSFAIVTHDETLTADSDRVIRLKDGAVEEITDIQPIVIN